MKKVIIPILIGLVVITVGALIYDQYNHNNINKTPYYHELKYSEFKEKIDNKDSFVLVIHQTGCAACETYLPTYKSVADENKLDVYGINRSNFSTTEAKEFAEFANISGTPTTVFVIDGEEKTTTNRFVGPVNSTKLTDRLKGLGLIK